jgi:PAS domain S-box-containing protein
LGRVENVHSAGEREPEAAPDVAQDLRDEAAGILGRSQWWADEQCREAASLQAARERPFGEELPAVIATDLAGAITHWNDGAQRLFGWSADEVIGRTITSVTVAPEDRPRGEKRMEQVRGTGAWEGEFPVLRRGGARFAAFVRLRTITDENGRSVGLLGVSVARSRGVRTQTSRTVPRRASEE